uniref:Uncharacterized protein n=1 Tax=Avena sativa TaxID=4498 RepID=A0ACD6AP25_AVESA
MMVRKSPPVLVRPPSPRPATTTTTGSDTIELSACDKAFVGIPNTALLVFTESIHDPAESIRRALTHALVHYHPLAGRLLRRAEADDDAGSEEVDYYIACTGEGVSFVAATTASSIDDVRFFNRSSVATSNGVPLLDDLAVYYPTADGDRPLVLVQVTEFSCGGFVVGVTWNHAAADGAGMGQFISAVANLASGLPSPSVLPVMRQGESLGAVVVHPAPSPSLLDIDRHFRSFDPPPDTAFLDIVIPSSTIDRVRAMATAMRGQGRTATMFEAVTAVLWQCRTRAVMSVKPEPGAPTVLCFSADLRRRAGAKDGYYGNLVTLQRAVSTSGEVAGGDIVEVVKIIQHAKDRIQIPAMSESEKKKKQQEDLDHLFIVTYWRNLGFDQVDFGGGKPARVLSCMRGPVGPPVNIITGNGEDGSCNVLSRCLKEHAQPLLHQLATFTTT